jgi:NAD(P)-dependent dehydrogenase (short-subunit alcohol dehydrogenase family)
MAQGSIVITGASSGIGEACALHFDKKGYRVFAGVRKASDGEALQAKTSDRLTPLVMDVTDQASIAAAAQSIDRKEISGLVNNAGIAVSAPIELIPIDKLREQLEVNVIGQVAVIQAFLPLLRHGRGRIVNIGSVAGRSTLPFTGAYSASKHALEAISGALRMELREWVIHVAIIEPGAVKTPIWEKGLQRANEMMERFPDEGLDLYRYLIAKMKKAASDAGKGGCDPSLVVEAVDHAMTSPKPKTRYVVGKDARMRMLMNYLPDTIRENIIMKHINSLTT